MPAENVLDGIIETPPNDQDRVWAAVEALCGAGLGEIVRDAPIGIIETVVRHSLGRIAKGVIILGVSEFCFVKHVKQRYTSGHVVLIADTEITADLWIL